MRGSVPSQRRKEHADQAAAGRGTWATTSSSSPTTGSAGGWCSPITACPSKSTRPGIPRNRSPTASASRSPAPEDVHKLRPRTFAVDREESLRRKQILEDAIGDILPVRLGNYDPFVYEFNVGEYGDLGFNGNFFFGLTWQVYRFIGNQGLLYWVYDAPDAIHQLMSYMLEDRIALFDFFEKEGLLALNTDSQMAGPRMYGYVSDLPDAESEAPVTLKNLWGWAESQEAANISPGMYKEFVLPYLARLSERFGLIYYGCCERVDDRLPAIIEAIPNLRSVSVSGWSDLAEDGRVAGPQLRLFPQTGARPHQRRRHPTGTCWKRTCGTPTRPPGTATSRSFSATSTRSTAIALGCAAGWT